jgi:hypothetical protein
MNQIPFSHSYPKLWGQITAELIAIRLLPAKDVQNNPDLLEYDTKYIDKRDYTGFEYKEVLEKVERFDYYQLPKSGNLIQLVFLGNKGIPFCTLRPEYSKMGNKLEYYKSKIGQEFEIVVKEVMTCES